MTKEKEKKEQKKKKDERKYQNEMSWKTGKLEGQIRLTGDQPLRDTLQVLGGWPVLDPDWQSKGSNMSVETLLGRMRGRFNQGVLLEQWVGPDDKNSSVNIIQVH